MLETVGTIFLYLTGNWQLVTGELYSDVKRGQILEAKAEANFLSPLITYKKSSLACKP